MILIVGAGISGLYMGFLLLQKNIPFIILEKGNNIGGKIFTEVYDTFNIEHGPSVLHLNQKNIVSLCQNLGVKLKEINDSFYSFTPLLNVKNLKDTHGTVGQRLNSSNCVFYYEAEYMLLSDYIKSIANQGKYMAPIRGFGYLCKKLKRKLKKYIKFGTLKEINNLNMTTIISSTGEEYFQEFSHIILCTTMNNLYNIKLPVFIPRDLTKTMSSLRIYVFLNRNIIDINPIFKYRVIYYPYGGLCIKINEKVILLCYTDGRNCEKVSIKNCLKFFSILKTDVQKISKFYFSDAYDLIISEKNLPIKLKTGLYQTSFPDRTNQCWIEGNLINCRKISDYLSKNPTPP